MSQILQDVRYAFRVLSNTPTVTIVAVISLALGIGANTAVFSLMNALILRSLPVRNPGQLVAISTISPDGQDRKDALSLSMFEAIRDRQQVFSSIFTWSGGGMSNFEANGVKYAASLNTVSGAYYSTLGVAPFLGRLITPEDVALNTGSSAQVAVLDYTCWQRRYSSDPAVIGKIIRVDGVPLTIVGVAPKNFAGLIIDAAPDVTAPIGFSGRSAFRERKNLWLEVMGRLKPGITLDQARAQLKTLWHGVQTDTVPEEFHGIQRERFFARRVEAESAATGTSYLRQRLSRPLVVLMAVVGLVLLIACANLANLMLARAAGRQHELGIRVALGASSWRLIRQILTESVMLSVAGAALGLLAAIWTSRMLAKTMWTGYVALALDPSPDLRVLVFAAAVALVTGVLFGLAPAWSITRTDPAGALRQSTRRVRGGIGAFDRILVSGQVALSLVLVIGAALFLRSLENLRSFDPGFRREGVLLMQLFPQAGREKIPNRTAYYRQLAEKLGQLPGVKSVSYSHMGPVLHYEFKEPVSAPSSSVAPVLAVKDWVGPGFFQLIGMRFLAGRDFDWRDDERSPRVAIVSESLARRLFQGASPIGRKLDVDSRPDHKGIEIVGVVNSASLWILQSHDPMAVYIPLMQEPAYNQSMVDIGTTGDPSALAPDARRTLESMGHHYPLRMQTLEERADMSLIQDRMLAMLSAFFGGLALLLASVGLYGLMSYAVMRRTSEIGLRMALGANAGNMVGLILREVMWLVLAGIAVGIPAALVASRIATGLLFGLSANDPSTIVLSAAILLGVGLFAGYLPARRASRIDPMVALRCE